MTFSHGERGFKIKLVYSLYRGKKRVLPFGKRKKRTKNIYKQLSKDKNQKQALWVNLCEENR